MKNPMLRTFCIAIVVGALFMTGCEGNTGVVEPPVVSAEDAAKNEARQADYSKSMEEAYGKKKKR